MAGEGTAGGRVWVDELQQCLAAAGKLDGVDDSLELALPDRRYSVKPFEFDSQPRRDARFQDPFNAGVNPEAFLYDERFSPQDKTLMMSYKRLRELDVPEMMASILVESSPSGTVGVSLRNDPAAMGRGAACDDGEVGFEALGIDWTKIPINFTWSLKP